MTGRWAGPGSLFTQFLFLSAAALQLACATPIISRPANHGAADDLERHHRRTTDYSSSACLFGPTSLTGGLVRFALADVAQALQHTAESWTTTAAAPRCVPEAAALSLSRPQTLSLFCADMGDFDCYQPIKSFDRPPGCRFIFFGLCRGLPK
ncbi:hypothetical protein BKA81DRAFT_75748 [Phyllosticta paracitricarpa]|uniref:Uncharacterized protein n=2 Tax=Phyllosticta TaxID=121621 RepID=A0ABR1M5P4_9PEZI